MGTECCQNVCHNWIDWRTTASRLSRRRLYILSLHSALPQLVWETVTFHLTCSKTPVAHICLGDSDAGLGRYTFKQDTVAGICSGSCMVATRADIQRTSVTLVINVARACGQILRRHSS